MYVRTRNIIDDDLSPTALPNDGCHPDGRNGELDSKDLPALPRHPVIQDGDVRTALADTRREDKSVR